MCQDLGKRDEFESWNLDALPAGPEYQMFAGRDVDEIQYKPFEEIGEDQDDQAFPPIHRPWGGNGDGWDPPEDDDKDPWGV